MRAAVVGCGRIGSELAETAHALGVQSHAGAFAASPHTDLVAVCDADPARATRAGELWGVPAFVEVEDLLRRARPELVAVATPDATHADVARTVLAAPGVRGALVEKPLALDAGEGGALVALALREGVALAVHYPRRTAPPYLELARRMADGAIGELQVVHGLYTGGVAHNGTHWFDLVRMLAGEIAWVEAADGLGEGGGDPTLDVALGLVDGARGTLTGLPRTAHATFELDLVGTAGRARLTEIGWRLSLEEAAPSPRFPGYRELAPAWEATDALHDAVLHAVEDLVAAVEEGRDPRATGPDAVAALAVADAARRSAVEGGVRVAVEAP
jgi:predicted dehydrogenase